ncbi:hypothetical protein C8R43DRAFT_1018954 [Mycena crocata]|nr:hypothetical protein C8R43DRAFT_1018954 [Mycena crocata]
MKISQLLCSPPTINPVPKNEAMKTTLYQPPADGDETFLFNFTSTDVAAETPPFSWKVWGGSASGAMSESSSNTGPLLTMRTNRCNICKVPGHKRDGCPRRATGGDINRHHAAETDEDTQVNMIELLSNSQYKCHRVRARCSLCNGVGHKRQTCSAVEWKCIGIEDLQSSDKVPQS